MGVINQAFRTVTCDGPICENTVTFDATTNGIPVEVMDANPWLKTNRVIQRADGKMFSYCSDTCEVNNVATGEHNSPEPQSVAPVSGGAAAIAAAAAAARQRQQADKAIREGQPAKVHLS
jgi:hypothetical protein